MGEKVHRMKISDTSPKQVMVSYDENKGSFPVSVNYRVGDGLDINKDVAILAAGINALIRLAEKEGESGGEILRSVVTQLEETFADAGLSVKTENE